MKTYIQLIALFSVLFLSENIFSQQLISSKEKNWKVHFGVIGGAGVSTYFENALPADNSFMPEQTNTYTVQVAPRPEATLGLFTEFEFHKKWSYRATLGYMMRAVPAPVFHDINADPGNTYQQLYLNGLSISGTWYFQPIDKFKFGLGYDHVHFLMNPMLGKSDYGEYASNYMMASGLRTEFIYKKDSRTDFILSLSAQSGVKGKMQVDNFSANILVSYRLCGKEIKMKKDIYKINYTN